MRENSSGDVAIAILAEELAERYRVMSKSHKTLHGRALMRVTAEILEILAQEALMGSVVKATIDRLEIIVRHLRINGLPYHRVDSLIRLVKRYYMASGDVVEYGVPQVDASNTILS